MNLRDLTQDDMNLTVWRYMPFSKFISLLVYQAIWFSKLNILQDQFEGMMPEVTKKILLQNSIGNSTRWLLEMSKTQGNF